jgi:hypothetical protein
VVEIRRRQFITLLGGAVAAWPLAAGAQQAERMRRIGVLTTTAADDPETQARIGAFLQGMKNLGGPSDATCASTAAGPLTPITFPETRPSW